MSALFLARPAMLSQTPATAPVDSRGGGAAAAAGVMLVSDQVGLQHHYREESLDRIFKTSRPTMKTRTLVIPYPLRKTVKKSLCSRARTATSNNSLNIVTLWL